MPARPARCAVPGPAPAGPGCGPGTVFVADGGVPA